MGYYCFSSYDISLFYLLMKKINLAISGCMGRLGQQLIKSSKKNKLFKLVSLTENRSINKKIYGISMLIEQAIPCFYLWFGFVPKADEGLIKKLNNKI